jgi:hypothetical protein
MIGFAFLEWALILMARSQLSTECLLWIKSYSGLPVFLNKKKNDEGIFIIP